MESEFLVKQSEKKKKQEFELYIPQKLKAIKKIQSKRNKNITFTIDEILNIEQSILISGQKGFGKTTLAKKLVEKIFEQKKEIFPLFLTLQNKNLKDIKSMLQSIPYFYNEKTISDFEQYIENNFKSIIIIIDDFDKNLDENEEINKFFLNLHLQKKYKYIYFTQYSFIDSVQYQTFLTGQENLQEFEILQLEKQQAKIYFDNYMKGNQVISPINLLEVQNSEILKSQIYKYKNHQNIENILVKLIKLSCIIDDFEQEAGNAFTTLKGIKSIIKRQDFSGTRLKNTSFNGMSFSQCNFELSQISNVDITYTWFIQCNLDSVFWNKIKRDEQQILISHNQYINSVSITNDNKHIAAGFGDQQIEIWNIKAAKKVAQFKAHEAWIQCIQFSKNNQILAFCCDQGRIIIWKCQMRKKIRVFTKLNQHYNSIRSISFSADGLFLASGGRDTNIYLRSLKTAKIITIFQGHTKEIQQIQFSPNGKYLASCGCDQSIRIWNIQNQKQEKILGETLDIYSTISFSTDSKYIAAGGQGSKVFIWDINSEQQMQAINSRLVENNECAQMKSILFSPDGNFLVFGALNKRIYFYRIIQTVSKQNKKKSGLKSGKFEMVYSHELLNEWNISLNCKWKEELPDLSYINSLVFTSDGENLISGNNDGTIKIFKTKQIKQQQFRRDSHQDFVLSVDFSPVGKILASSGQDETIRLWDIEAGRQLHILQDQNRYIYDVKFSNDGEKLASCGVDKKIKIWKVSSGQLIFFLKGHDKSIRSLRFSPSQPNILASGGLDQTVILWDIEKKIKINQIECNHNIYEITYSSCGTVLATCGEGLKFWNPNQGTEIKRLKGDTKLISIIAFSQDGKDLASVSNNEEIILWNMDSGNQIKAIQNIASISQLKFSPNGLLLASANNDSTISVYQINEALNSYTIFRNKILTEHTSSVVCVAFSPDSNYLASCSTDNTIVLWSIDKNQGNEDKSKKDEQNQFGYQIAPLYKFSNDFCLKTDLSSFKNAIMLSKNGSNLTHFFVQLGGSK